MATDSINLPEGFVLEEPAVPQNFRLEDSASMSLPNGFVFDKEATELEPLTILGQAFMQSMADKPAMMLRGTEVYTPDKYGIGTTVDPILHKASMYLESMKDPEIEAKIQKARAGKLWPVGENKRWYQVQARYLPEVINAWAANVGDQIPIMLATQVGRMIGKYGGKLLGAGSGIAAAGATGGPDPSDVATAPAVAKLSGAIIEHIGGAAPLVAMEAGGFVDEAERLGIDKHISEKYARIYGLGSGAIEYSQAVYMLASYKRLPKGVKDSALKAVLKEIGGATIEGLEEVSQGGLQNWLLQKAVEEMKEIHPGYTGKAPKILEDAEREFGVGFGVTILTRMPGHGAKYTAKKIDKALLNWEQKQTVEQNPVPGLENPEMIETAEGTIGWESDYDGYSYRNEIQLEQILNDIERRKKKKGILSYLGVTPKWTLNRMLGLEPMLEDIDAAWMAKEIERRDLHSWLSSITKKLKKLKSIRKVGERIPEAIETEREAKTEAVQIEQPIETAEGTIGEQISEIDVVPEPEETVAHKFGEKLTSDKPVAVMVDLLDTYEDAPEFLTDDEASIFRQVRELTRYMRDRANRVRRKMGMDEINEVKAYITHWIDAASRAILRERESLPVQTGYMYKLMRGLPKNIVNPTAMRRQLVKDMNEKFSKDLGLLLSTMINYDLRDIYIMYPYQQAWEELQSLRENEQITDATFNEIEAYLAYDIRELTHPMDKAFDNTFMKVADWLNKFILPTSRYITSPSRSLFRFLRRMSHLSALAARPRPGLRNLGQKLLLGDLYRYSDIFKAQFSSVPMVEHPITGEMVNLLELIREQDWYQISVRKFIEVDSKVRGFQAVSMLPYQMTHIGNRFFSNVELSALTGYYDWQYRYQQSQDIDSPHHKHCEKMAKQLNVPVTELLTQKGDMMWNIREAVRRTQWEYMSISMPSFYRGEMKKAIGTFQSWWLNYFFNHGREMINQISTGRNSQGRLLTPRARLRALKGLGSIVAIGKASKAFFGIQMLRYLFIPAPGFLPPIPEFVVGVMQLIAAWDDEKKAKKAMKRIGRSLKIWIPFQAAMKDLNRLLSGEWDIADYLFYRETKK